VIFQHVYLKKSSIVRHGLFPLAAAWGFAIWILAVDGDRVFVLISARFPIANELAQRSHERLQTAWTTIDGDGCQVFLLIVAADVNAKLLHALQFAH
jgi:hypothetical protein